MRYRYEQEVGECSDVIEKEGQVKKVTPVRVKEDRESTRGGLTEFVPSLLEP